MRRISDKDDEICCGVIKGVIRPDVCRLKKVYVVDNLNSVIWLFIWIRETQVNKFGTIKWH